MKAQINNLKRDRGFTLLEMVTAMVLFAIIMTAVFTFISYTAATTNFTHENAFIQNEMRLMMKLIRDEVNSAQGLEIRNNMPRSALTAGDRNQTLSLLAFDENNSRKTFNIEHKPAGGTSVEKVWDFNEMPYLEVNFQMKFNTHNILVVTLTNKDPDPKFQLTLTDEIFLPNALPPREHLLYCDDWYCWPCPCVVVQRPLLISPPGGGNSLLMMSPNPAPVANTPSPTPSPTPITQR